MNGSAFHRSATRLLSLAMIAIGVALIVQAIAGHGALRALLGALFIAAGIGRSYIEVRRGRRA